MTNLIQKAREKWCEPVLQRCDPFLPRSTLSTPIWYPCPPEVVAALLEAYEFVATPVTGCRCVACEIRRQQWRDDLLAAVDSAITRALEQKP